MGKSDYITKFEQLDNQTERNENSNRYSFRGSK